MDDTVTKRAPIVSTAKVAKFPVGTDQQARAVVVEWASGNPPAVVVTFVDPAHGATVRTRYGMVAWFRWGVLGCGGVGGQWMPVSGGS